ncbi:V-set domain-containing T-cell activation inhibitor 1-like [Anabas testudineus]|uniref:V-set domain-containing T-cell activation inhibitor 1-like n=1 Tax=Anabas testudineus TaxID=64144 RepID=UPI00143DEAFF|nr:V-set domain-containing T-cell activation inhibitor 1-like [Anabas testudineus]
MFPAVLCCSVLLTVLFLQSNGQQIITARLGLNVILPCRTSSSAPIRAAEWSRPDLKSEYVFFYRNKQSDKTYQHPSFKGRVELADSQIKDGNLSLILKNVIRSDAGTYECRVHSAEDTARNKRAVIKSGPISIVHLTVIEPRNTPGNTGNGQHMVGLLCLQVITVILYVLAMPY